ncbi:hypothetical protein Mapa_003380 [Marchantia paleacea]|nr:hypothetical protein Mapa_003380 [Marchantia paleacea]
MNHKCWHHNRPDSIHHHPETQFLLLIENKASSLSFKPRRKHVSNSRPYEVRSVSSASVRFFITGTRPRANAIPVKGACYSSRRTAVHTLGGFTWLLNPLAEEEYSNIFCPRQQIWMKARQPPSM